MNFEEFKKTIEKNIPDCWEELLMFPKKQKNEYYARIGYQKETLYFTYDCGNKLFFCDIILFWPNKLCMGVEYGKGAPHPFGAFCNLRKEQKHGSHAWKTINDLCNHAEAMI